MELLRSSLHYWKSVLQRGSGTFERAMYTSEAQLERLIPTYNAIITDFNEWHGFEQSYNSVYREYYSIEEGKTTTNATITNTSFIYIELFAGLFHIYPMQKYTRPTPKKMMYILKNKYGLQFYNHFIYFLRKKLVCSSPEACTYRDLYLDDIDSALLYAFEKTCFIE